MNLKKRINRHQAMAIQAMESNPECRNDDLELMLEVLSHRGVSLTENQKYAIKTCGVEFKTLLRQRQYLQSIGKYLPTRPEVLKKRRKLAAENAEYYSEMGNL